MAKNNNASGEGKNVSNEVNEAEQKRLATIEKIKKDLELNASKGHGTKVKVEGVGETPVLSCGNCKWLKQKDERGISCSDLGVTADLLPCSVKRSGNGFFEPILLTPGLQKAKDAVGGLGKAELLLVAPMLDARREMILSEGITGFAIADKVICTHKGSEYNGEVESLSRTHVKVVTTDGKTFNLLPGSVKKVAA